jgi:hypothetical protein
MNRALISVVASLILFLNLLLGSAVQAQSIALAETSATAMETAKQDWVEELKTKIIPEIKSILTPQQNDQLETAIIDEKKSLRKAFKSLTLTPDQKTKLASVFKALPAKEIFTAMTPGERKSFFLKQKSVFMPTPEEIGDKISAKMKMAKEKSSLAPSAEAIAEKIGQKMERLKDQLLP